MSDEQAIERVRAYVEAPYELHDESQAQWRADLRTLLRLATPPVTGEVGESRKLRAFFTALDDWIELGGGKFDNQLWYRVKRRRAKLSNLPPTEQPS